MKSGILSTIVIAPYPELVQAARDVAATMDALLFGYEITEIDLSSYPEIVNIQN